MIKIGLIINPVAGVGGKAGLKGSDGIDIQKIAIDKGGTFEAANKVKIALTELLDNKENIMFLTAPKQMGEDVLKELGFLYEVVGKIKEATSGEDTEKIAALLKEKKVDLLVFAGGDGTARNIYNAVGLSLPSIGIPAGVKIHSAVFANTPHSGGEVIKNFVEDPEGIYFVDSEVMDIDEALFRENVLEAKLYGYLSVPQVSNLMQQAKSSASHHPQDIIGITEAIKRKMLKETEDTCYIFGTGGTTYHILKELGFEGSLLGIDVIKNAEMVLTDATEVEIYSYIQNEKNIVLIVTIIGGQGHIFGRGNQQLSPRVLKLIPKDNIWVVASAEKVNSLQGNPLIVDTSDRELDKALSGYKIVIIGSEQSVLCKIEGE